MTSNQVVTLLMIIGTSVSYYFYQAQSLIAALFMLLFLITIKLV